MIEYRTHDREKRFIADVLSHTPIIRLVLLLLGLWLLFSFGIYQAELDHDGSRIKSYGEALYWGIAAFSTAGIADMPQTDTALLLGGIWIVVGSLLYFGAIVAVVTAYFLRPLQTPSRQIIATIEDNLERLEDLSLEELELLKETTDALIEEVERIRLRE